MKKLLHKIYDELRWIKKFIIFFIDYKKVGKDCFVIFCTPEHGNLGDHAIFYAQSKFLKNIDASKEILEVPCYLLCRHLKIIAKLIGTRMIFIHGGGFLGTLWLCLEQTTRNIIETFHNNKIIILPQTIYFTDNEEGKGESAITKSIYDNHPNLWLCAREEKSYDIAQELFDNVHVELVPDMVPYLNGFKFNVERKGALLCLRRDKEKVLTDQDELDIKEILASNISNGEIESIDTVMDYNISNSERETEIKKIIEVFSKCCIIITDRLHGMIFAALAGTPCIAFGNCNQKVKGIYNWVKENDYIIFLEDLNHLNDEVKRLLLMKNNSYHNEKLLEKYKILENIIKADL